MKKRRRVMYNDRRETLSHIRFFFFLKRRGGEHFIVVDFCLVPEVERFRF